MTRSSSCSGHTWPLLLFLQTFNHVYLAGQQRNHSCFVRSPWRSAALDTYPTKGTKSHCEITLEFLTPDKTMTKHTHETEEEWELSPVPTLSYVRNGGPVDTSSQCKASFGYCICNKSFLFYYPALLTVYSFLMDGFIFSALKDSEIMGHIDTAVNCSSYVCNISMYAWSCSFTGGYLQELRRLLTDIDYMLTNVFVKLTLSCNHIKNQAWQNMEIFHAWSKGEELWLETGYKSMKNLSIV